MRSFLLPRTEPLTTRYLVGTKGVVQNRLFRDFRGAGMRFDVLTLLLPESIVKLRWLKPQGGPSPSFAHESSELTDAAADILRSSAYRDSRGTQPDRGVVRSYHTRRGWVLADCVVSLGNRLGRRVFGTQP